VEIRPVRAESFLAGRRTDGRTDITNLIVAFLSFANALKNYSKFVESISEVRLVILATKL